MTPTQQKFIILRSESTSFDVICKKLKTSKSTLIQWSKLYDTEISDMQFLAIEAIKSEYAHNQVQKYKQLMQHLQKMDKGISDADLSETSLKDMYTVRNAIFYQLEKMEQNTVYKDTRVSKKCDIMGTTEILKMKLSEL